MIRRGGPNRVEDLQIDLRDDLDRAARSGGTGSPAEDCGHRDRARNPGGRLDQIPPRDVSARHRLLALPHFPPPCLVLPPYSYLATSMIDCGTRAKEEETLQWVFSEGFDAYCPRSNGHYYKFEIANHGGRLTVTPP